MNLTSSKLLEHLMLGNGQWAMGCDGISPKLLKHCAIALYQPLYHLFSLSISQFYIPKEWRTHLIKPIFKSGNKSSITITTDIFPSYVWYLKSWKNWCMTTLLTLSLNPHLLINLVFQGADLHYNSYFSPSTPYYALHYKLM